MKNFTIQISTVMKYNRSHMKAKQHISIMRYVLVGYKWGLHIILDTYVSGMKETLREQQDECSLKD